MTGYYFSKTVAKLRSGGSRGQATTFEPKGNRESWLRGSRGQATTFEPKGNRENWLGG